MDRRIKPGRVSVLVVAAALLIGATVSRAQKDSSPKKRLHSPAIAHGLIGGESHNSYVIRARKGQMMTVQISWQPHDNNRAEFTVSRSANFFNGTPVKFGKNSDQGKHWSGKIPATGDYYLYVVAHPTAHYNIRVTVK
jgi:hypothetical protein